MVSTRPHKLLTCTCLAATERHKSRPLVYSNADEELMRCGYIGGTPIAPRLAFDVNMIEMHEHLQTIGSINPYSFIQALARHHQVKGIVYHNLVPTALILLLRSHTSALNTPPSRTPYRASAPSSAGSSELWMPRLGDLAILFSQLALHVNSRYIACPRISERVPPDANTTRRWRESHS